MPSLFTATVRRRMLEMLKRWVLKCDRKIRIEDAEVTTDMPKLNPILFCF